MGLNYLAIIYLYLWIFTLLNQGEKLFEVVILINQLQPKVHLSMMFVVQLYFISYHNISINQLRELKISLLIC
jgi:hypothetical protein